MTLLEENEILRERIQELSDELSALRKENRYVCVHNQLNSFNNPLEFVPVSSIGDNELRQTVVEIQTGSEDLNVQLAEFICVLLNKGVFKSGVQ